MTVLGQNASGNGTLIVDGAGSELISNGTTTVGDAGNGILYIRDGGSVSGADAIVAALRGSTGTLIVDGISSRWNNRGGLDIGGGGDGLIELINGGMASDATTEIGQNAGTNGTVIVVRSSVETEKPKLAASTLGDWGFVESWKI